MWSHVDCYVEELYNEFLFTILFAPSMKSFVTYCILCSLVLSLSLDCALFYINLESSHDRNRDMVSMLSRIDINATRVNAKTTADVYNLEQTGALLLGKTKLFSPGSKETGKSLSKKRCQCEYSYKEAAVTISHLEAVQRAYESQHEFAIITEDDILLGDDFMQDLEQAIHYAPHGWEVLQLRTVNVFIDSQLRNIIDPYIDWMPEHW